MNPKRLPRMISPLWRRMATLIALTLVTQNAAGLLWNFVPSDIEWQAWPDYCRARYQVTPPGRESKYAAAMPAAAVSDWKNKLEDVWYGLHHYCGGLVDYSQAVRAKRADWKRHKFEEALEEANFTIARSNSRHPFFSVMLAFRGRVFAELGHNKEAHNDFQQAIQLHPEIADPYAAYGLMLRRSGKLQEARELLDKGMGATKGGSAEMHYIFGFVLFDLKDYAGAAAEADLAYAKGYPLPGLRRKLEAVGYRKK